MEGRRGRWGKPSGVVAQHSNSCSQNNYKSRETPGITGKYISRPSVFEFGRTLLRNSFFHYTNLEDRPSKSALSTHNVHTFVGGMRIFFVLFCIVGTS